MPANAICAITSTSTRWKLWRVFPLSRVKTTLLNYNRNRTTKTTLPTGSQHEKALTARAILHCGTLRIHRYSSRRRAPKLPAGEDGGPGLDRYRRYQRHGRRRAESARLQAERLEPFSADYIPRVE